MTTKLKRLFGQKGEISRTLIILAVVIIILAIIVYYVTRVLVFQHQKPPEVNNGPPAPVYEGQVGDVNFVFESAADKGSILYGKASHFPTFQQNITTTDRFIIVVVTAQDKAKVTIPFGTWSLGNIIDDQGRVFVPVTNKAYSWIPNPDQCSAELKPEFTPTPCLRIYEVSKASAKLQLQIQAQDVSGRNKTGLLDLNVVK